MCRSEALMNTYKHLSMRERIAIQTGVAMNKSLTSIAKELGKSVSTITKEIKRHLLKKKTNCTSRKFNPCKYAKTCRTKHVCNNSCGYVCATCGKCINTCKNFVYHECEKLKRSPYCCNGCKKNIHI